LRVATAEAFRALVAQKGLEQAYAATDVVVASGAEFTNQASLLLQLGPTDPPMRIRHFRLGPAEGQGGHGNTDLLLPLGQGGALALEALLRGDAVPFSASGSGGEQQPRLELETQLTLEQIGAGRLLLHRGVVENGVVAVSSRDGLTPTPWGPVLGPLVSALYSCAGAGSIGLTMPALAALGPGSPLLVAGGLGWVSGAGSGHNPQVKRRPDGQALSPGACAAVEVNLHDLNPRWLRATRLGGEETGLLVALAAPVPLLDVAVARQAATGNSELEAPVLDYGIPRRVRPSFGRVPYSTLHSGELRVGDNRLSCAPAHSPRLAAEIAEALVGDLQSGRFPLRSPLAPLPKRAALQPLD
jgi:uncharacterized protein (DUF39 family)